MNHEPATHHALFDKIAALIQQARQTVAAAANLAMVHTYFEVGRMIVEDEQAGQTRAAYGKNVLKDLSQRLTETFGKGFSEVNLRQIRKFYEVFSIQQTLSAESGKPRFRLSWSHYLLLMRIENPQERSFYEIEAAQNQWSLSTMPPRTDASKLNMTSERSNIGRRFYDVLATSERSNTTTINNMRPLRGRLKDTNEHFLPMFDLSEVMPAFKLPRITIFPDKHLLQQKLAQWIVEYEQQHPKPSIKSTQGGRRR